MRAASKRDVKMNTRREIPYQQVPMYYFIFYINCQYYFIFYINSIIAFYCQEKSTLLTNENRRIDNSQIKIVKWGSRWKNALNHYKTKMGVMSINKILSYWLCPFGKNWPVANLPAVDVRCQWQEMSVPKPLNMQVLVFLFVFWFSIPSING